MIEGMSNYLLKYLVFSFLLCFISSGRDPLTDKRRASSAGRPSDGLGTLVTELPPDDPVKIAFKQMLKEIEKHGGRIHTTNFGGALTFGSHLAISPNVTLFRYNPERLRAIDALEEILHWEQIKEGGAYWRDYSSHPLYQKFQSQVLIMEDLAKRSLLQHEDLSPQLRDEQRGELARVQEDTYSSGSFAKEPCSVIKKLVY